MIARPQDHLENYVAPGAKSPLLSADVRGDIPPSNTRWGHIWDNARDDVEDLPHRYRFHDLHHTGLTIFAQEGATPAELMRRGGHADINIVLRYLHATMTRDQELAERMSQRAVALEGSPDARNCGV